MPFPEAWQTLTSIQNQVDPEGDRSQAKMMLWHNLALHLTLFWNQTGRAKITTDATRTVESVMILSAQSHRIVTSLWMLHLRTLHRWMLPRKRQRPAQYLLLRVAMKTQLTKVNPKLEDKLN